ncbi:enoyl-CoA hydratase-related protein [Streptomyces sp. NPDC048385]|uniref:enoyl-CoA hydratase-related protein n=1 Tax=Streptomyces sp. NPDC048385 TaxID=3155145 RepID=UPI00343B32EC
MTDGVVHTKVEGPVGHARLDRPHAANALNRSMMTTLLDAVRAWDADPEVRCVVISGTEKVFAAGADIAELAELSRSGPVGTYLDDFSDLWEALYVTRIPLIAAVSGHVLGGGCELAMICDLVIASETARFGQPEVRIGAIPGAGGTQRLVRAVGKALAMDMILTGRTLTAPEALAAGLVSRVVPAGELDRVAHDTARTIAEHPAIAVRVAKEAVLAAFESPLSAGIRTERRLAALNASTNDHIEGLQAFLDKRRR